ncbi:MULTISPECIES: YdeI/OmpD-associated family protein [unclassified Mucilaginibacter]|uniref:YdeI/OmpD-associated family protein n=1 Tax=unclassified Mucilaginibacter TaxID=2617802 RepID=UPI002AC962A3|nr:MULTISPECIES: YdeI/OmpD-associated family protein [unclassified Mucilaginibacter]MEB0262449.1 YdeI/OmpD-associated family protein [Mucilaginibacter sp. 10I4]MEB0279274.1 YdeI/OmpD-associated family protein [Mucilaginibacter sp. 10B2]MEB0302588.1 YdeI/OmpD-associated family protein [Mucilaginibacter sp. 5C4]WPX23214.1 YdeI/OmpD-associated family protein [Mucilaginibacter sp. 5C4]
MILYLAMVDFTTIILQVAEQGDRMGWTYIEVPADVAQQLLPGNKKSFRVRGKLDNFEIAGMALMPVGSGNFFMSLREDIRKGIRKTKGATLRVQLEHDIDFKIEMPDDLKDCFDYEQSEAFEYFNSLAKSHQGYFIKWITDAKTEDTRANRIAKTINAAIRRMDYGAILREQKKLRE